MTTSAEIQECRAKGVSDLITKQVVDVSASFVPSARSLKRTQAKSPIPILTRREPLVVVDLDKVANLDVLPHGLLPSKLIRVTDDFDGLSILLSTGRHDTLLNLFLARSNPTESLARESVHVLALDDALVPNHSPPHFLLSSSLLAFLLGFGELDALDERLGLGSHWIVVGVVATVKDVGARVVDFAIGLMSLHVLVAVLTTGDGENGKQR